MFDGYIVLTFTSRQQTPLKRKTTNMYESRTNGLLHAANFQHSSGRDFCSYCTAINFTPLTDLLIHYIIYFFLFIYLFFFFFKWCKGIGSLISLRTIFSARAIHVRIRNLQSHETRMAEKNTHVVLKRSRS